MRFVSSRVRAEWVELIDRGGLVVALASVVDTLSQAITGRDALVTDILRYPEEQVALCEEMGVPYYRSVHEFWRGIDFRSHDWTPEQGIQIVGHVNELFWYGGRFQAARIHTGTAPHLHLQAPRADAWGGIRK